MIILIVAVTMVATVLLVWAVGVLLARRQPALERRLAGYERHEDIPVMVEAHGPETAVVQQAVDFTGRMAEKAGFLIRVERSLEQAALPIRASELVFYVAIFAILAFMIMAITIGWIAGLITAGFVVLVPVAYVIRKQRDRTTAFERQLPDVLTLLASSLRAGFSFMQGLESVSQEIGEPTRAELQRVFTEVRLGRAVEDALDDAAERMQSRDLSWAVQAIKIQREVGGNLATLLDTVADTMRKREQLRRELSALTAEGRLSAIVLSLMPLAMAVALYLLQPTYLETLFNHAIGVIAVIGAVLLSVVGWIWLQRIMDIEV